MMMIEMDQEKRDSIINGLEATAMYGEPASEILPLLDVGNERYLEFFRGEILGRLVYSGGSTCRFFEGHYGAGKTHLLGLLERTALTEGLAVVRTDLSSDLGLGDWHLVTSYILQNITAIINGEVKRSVADILEAMGRTKVKSFQKLKRVSLSHPGFKNAIVKGLQMDYLGDDARQYLRKFLQGGKVTTADLKKVGIEGVKNPLNERNSEIVLRTIIEALNILGIPGFMLLFDENEKTLLPSRRKPSRKNILSANTIRHLIDSCINGNLPRTIVIFTILPGFLETSASYYQALGQRLALIRDMEIEGSWRWPVLTIEQVNTSHSPEDFLEQVIDRFCVIVEECGYSANGLTGIMKVEGEKILLENAGSGYKRDLMKSLSALAADRIKE